MFVFCISRILIPGKKCKGQIRYKDIADAIKPCTGKLNLSKLDMFPLCLIHNGIITLHVCRCSVVEVL